MNGVGFMISKENLASGSGTRLDYLELLCGRGFIAVMNSEAHQVPWAWNEGRGPVMYARAHCGHEAVVQPRRHRGSARHGATGPTLLPTFSTTGDEQGVGADGAREGVCVCVCVCVCVHVRARARAFPGHSQGSTMETAAQPVLI